MIVYTSNQENSYQKKKNKFPFGIHPHMTHSINDTEWEHFYSRQDLIVLLFQLHGPGPYRHRRGSPLANLQYLHCDLQTAACRGMQLPKGGIHQGMFSWLILSTQMAKKRFAWEILNKHFDFILTWCIVLRKANGAICIICCNHQKLQLLESLALTYLQGRWWKCKNVDNC